MRIAIVTTQVPFVIGGAELHALRLRDQLRLHGHLAEIVSLPFKWYPPGTLLDHMLAATLTDVSEYNGVPIDLAIGLKFPAYLATHPNMVIWLLHQYRAAYDEWDSGVGDLLFHAEGKLARDAIRRADDVALRRVKTIFANSRNVASRLKRYNDINSTPLYHPPPLADQHDCRGYEDYLYFPSRLSAPKRQSLVIEALARTRSPVKVVFAGPPDNPAYADELQTLAVRHGVEDRITWLGAINDDQMIDSYARARAVIYPPRDEDYGYVTLEAMLSRKAVLTCSDSGGPLEFVQDGVNGLIAQPKAEALANAMDEIWDDPARAETMGEAAWHRYQQMGISWQNVIAQLTNQPVGAIVPSAQDKSTSRPSPAAIIGKATRPEVDDVVERLGFDNIAGLARIYDLRAVLDDASAYQRHDTRFARYATALSMVELAPRMKVLLIGADEPQIFYALVKRLWPDVLITTLEETGQPEAPVHIIHAQVDGAWDFEIIRIHSDIETGRLPSSDQNFDLVVLLDTLERLPLNPAALIEEVARVTRPGGQVLVITPNSTSHQALTRMMAGRAPYASGTFQPLRGLHGRQHREWTPSEVEALMASSGFEVAALKTVDVGDVRLQPRTADLLLAWQRDPTTVGETIFYLGTRGLSSGAPPPYLYPTDPRLYRGKMSARRRRPDDADVHLSVTNTSPLLWHHDGASPVKLELRWLNDDAVLTQEHVLLPLPRTIEASETLVLTLRLGAEPARYEGAVRIRLIHVGQGAFDALGKTNTVLLPLDRQSFEKFMKAPQTREA